MFGIYNRKVRKVFGKVRKVYSGKKLESFKKFVSLSDPIFKIFPGF